MQTQVAHHDLIPLAHIGQNCEVRVGYVRLFNYQHVLIGNAKYLQGPHANGFAVKWYEIFAQLNFRASSLRGHFRANTFSRK